MSAMLTEAELRETALLMEIVQRHVDIAMGPGGRGGYNPNPDDDPRGAALYGLRDYALDRLVDVDRRRRGG